MNENKQHYEDIDDFIASVFQKNQTTNKTPVHQTQKVDSSENKKTAKDKNVRPRNNSSETHNNSRHRSPLSIIIPVTGVAVAIIFTAAIWHGPLQARIYPSPFTDEIKENLKQMPLYYPTALPNGYKIDRDTMTKPSSDVLLFAASNDSNERVVFSTQRRPNNLDTKPFTDTLASTKYVETKLGSAVIGTSSDGKKIASFLTDSVWIIITADQSSLTTEQLESLINSLRRG